MPDTGAPWNIPFLDGTELVRAYPDFSEDLADAVADGLSAAGNAGIGSNVVSTTKSNLFTTTSTSFTAVSDLEAIITPTTDTSQILIIGQIPMNYSAGSAGYFRLMNGATPIAIGDASGSRSRVTGGFSAFVASSYATQPFVFLHSPESTSAQTYSVEVRVSSGTLRVGTSGDDADNVNVGRSISTITAIEVAA